MEQKRAWFILVWLAFSSAMFLPLSALAGIRGASLTVILFFLGVLGQYLIREKSSPGKVVKDERDKAIFKAASLWGGMAFFVTTILACLVCMFSRQVSVMAFGVVFILVVGQVAFWVVKSISTLICYGREPKDV